MGTDAIGGVTRRQFVVAVGAGLTIVPRHVLGGRGFVAPSDRIGIATIGAGRQGLAVTMSLLKRQDVHLVAVCDVNRGSRDYAEYGDNDTLNSARELLGPGHEHWGEQWTSPGRVQLTKSFSTSLGMGGRDPAKLLIEAYYASRSGSTSYAGCTAYSDYRELLARQRDLDAVYVATPDHWHAPIAIAAMRAGKHVLGQKPMCHAIGETRRMAAVARETKVATSVTINNPSTEHTRLITQWLADGAIGTVREVHNWSTRPYWPQGVERPADVQPVPADFNWDFWLGPAPARPVPPLLSAVLLARLVRLRLRLLRRHGLLQLRRPVQDPRARTAPRGGSEHGRRLRRDVSPDVAGPPRFSRARTAPAAPTVVVRRRPSSTTAAAARRR